MNLSFLFKVASTFILLAIIVVANFVIDPWSLFPKFHLTMLKRSQTEPHARLYKDTQILMRDFDTVYLGSSRVDVGLPVINEKDFNLAYPGGSLEESIYIAERIIEKSIAKQIVIGLDFDRFRSKSKINYQSHLECLNTNSGHCIFELVRKYFLNIDVMVDSFKTAAKNFKSQSFDVYSARGQRTDEYMLQLRGNEKAEVIFEKFFASEHDVLKNFTLLESKFELLEKFCNQLQPTSPKIAFVILPYHDSWFKFVDQIGATDELKQWITRLHSMKTCNQRTTIVDMHRLEQSSEPITGQSGHMKYFWDPTHFKSPVGKEVVESVKLKWANDT